MKPGLLTIILVISVLIITNVCMVYAYTELSTPSSIQSEGQVPFTPGPLLDDFRYAAPVNLWNVVTSTFSSSSLVPMPADAICTASYINDSNAYSGYSLKLDYNVSALNSYAGYSSQMGGGSLVTPTAYTAVSFWVKGAAGGEFFKVELRNKGTTLYYDSNNNANYYRNDSTVYITDYLDGGVTTAWQKVTIPLANFASLDDWSSMKEFVLVFENAQSTANGSLARGTVYIDDIAFETNVVNTVRIAHFGEAVATDTSGNKKGVCALGGNIGTAIGSGGIISYGLSNETNSYNPYPYGLSLNYDVNSSGAWAATYLIFGGGIDPNPDLSQNKSGWIAIPQDFSAYNYLSLMIRGKSSTENPKTIKIELVDSGGTKSYVIAGIITNWQTLKIPLSSFPLLRKDSIKQMTFVLEGWRIDAAVGNKVGTVLIDSVQFEK